MKAINTTIKLFGLIAILAIIGFTMTACDDGGGNNNEFVAVTNINFVSGTATAGVPFTLSGTVEPANATNKAIIWSVKSAGTTGASISGNGNILTTTASGTATITATIANGAAVGTAYTRDFTVSVSPNMLIFSDLSELAVYLAGSSPDSTAEDPIPVKVNINLTNDWESLLDILNMAKKFVYLDLSDSTGMTSFDTGTTTAGRNFIATLILPKTVIGIPSNAFDGFTSLREIRGSNVVTLNSRAFFNRTSLRTAVFPLASSIGNEAFSGCTALNSVTLGNISSGNFSSTSPFPGNLRAVYFAANGGAGTYITENPGNSAVWTKQGNQIITITTQPTATTNLYQGSISGSLTVQATVTSGAALSYQWYSNTSNSNTGGTVINGATSSSFTIPATLTVGTYYYFCEVTSAGATPVRSNVASVNVNAPITITGQPTVTTAVIQGNISGSLSVSATAMPGAALSYQWYSNTSNSNTGGTAISGATSSSFTIPAIFTVGTYYYFCEVMSVGVTPVRSNVASVIVVDGIVSTTGIEMVRINAGTFTMGSNNSDDLGADRPRQVTLAQGFYMGQYEVTQAQWEAVMTGNTNGISATPSHFSSSPVAGDVQERRPVENVSWYEIIVFCNRLSIMEGLTPAYSVSGDTNPDDWGNVWDWDDFVMILSDSTGYRLPTEAEWEYACRAGSTTAWSCGSTANSSYMWRFQNRTREVGKRLPNAWGLYDMHMNVWEWCLDGYLSTYGGINRYYRWIRGGGWYADVRFSRSASRSSVPSGSKSKYVSRNELNNEHDYDSIGFRLVRP